MHVAIVLVGDELLSGHTRDANGHFMAQRLDALGHRLRRIAVVPDEPNAIVAEVDYALLHNDVVLLSGGLGPTHDDRTTETLADRFHRRLVVDEAQWQRIVTRYGKRFPNGVPKDTEDSAKKMVTVPEGAEVLENPVGAACGYVLREGPRAVVVMPGVPAELAAIFERSVVGHILPPAVPPTLIELEVFLAEAEFATTLSDIADRFPDVQIGSYPHFGEKHVTLRFKGERHRAQAALDAFETEVPHAGAPR